MKKFIIIIGFLFCFCSLSVFAQTNVSNKFIDGYEDLAWGTSFEKVKNKYPNISRSWDVACQTGEECWKAESNSIARFFRFYNKKLYWVKVIYEDMTQQQFNALTEKLVEKYGTIFFDLEKEDNIKFGYQWLASSDLTVTVSVVNKTNGFGVKLGEWVFVEYCSLLFLKQMQKAEAENIEL